MTSKQKGSVEANSAESKNAVPKNIASENAEAKNTEPTSKDDTEFLAQLEATFALDPLERVSTYEALAQKLEADLD